MKKDTNMLPVSNGGDGPTSVFLLKRNAKPTWKQKIQKCKYKIKRTHVEKTLKPESHTLDEVMTYMERVHGLAELAKDSPEVKEEYNQMRAAFMIQYAPDLMGEYAERPQLMGETQEDIRAHFAQIQLQMQKASEIPTTEFDIDFHKFQKSFDDINDNIHIIIEKRFGYIGGGASGNKKIIKKFQRMYKDIHRYYGVTAEDIRTKSKRYQNVVRALSQ